MTPDDRSLDYRPEREPTADEIRELTTWWLRTAKSHLRLFTMYSEDRHLADSEYLGLEAQWRLERSFKGLVAADNDAVRFRRDAALMWWHVESTNPIADREGAEAMENLLAATTGWDAPLPRSPRHICGTNRRRRSANGSGPCAPDASSRQLPSLRISIHSSRLGAVRKETVYRTLNRRRSP